jgi:hypothetical protein
MDAITIKNPGARNNITPAYMFGELSPSLMTPVLIDGAAGLALATPALEGGLIFHLRMLFHSVLRAEAQRRGLVRARSDDPPQRIEHLSGSASLSGSDPQVTYTRRSYRVT